MGNRKPKILHTMTWLAPGGGVDNNVFLTLQGLSNEYEFHFAVGKEIHHNPFRELHGIKFFVCEHLVRKICFFSDLKALIFFWKLIKREKYDVVHTHETKASLITRIAAYMAGCKCIIYGLHGVTFNDPHSVVKKYFYIFIEKMTIWMADFIISVSQDAIEQYHKNKIGLNIPYKVVYSGIDINKFINHGHSLSELNDFKKKLSIDNNDIVLLSIGRFSKAKAQKYTIESFANLKKTYKNLKLIFVGEGDCRENCIQLARKYKVNDSIVFYGFSDEIAKFTSISDIFVITSLREGLPRVVVEASLSWLPTVGFEVEGIREIITSGESGFIVPKYDVELLTERIKKLIDSETLRSEFATKAFEKACQYWSHDYMNEQLRKIYTNLIGTY